MDFEELLLFLQVQVLNIKMEKPVLAFRWNTLSVLAKQKSCVEMLSCESAGLRVWKRLTVTVGISFGVSSIQLLVFTQLVGTSSPQSNEIEIECCARRTLAERADG